MHPGRGQESGGLHHLLGRQPGRMSPAALHQVHADPEGQVRAGGPQGPHHGPRGHSGNGQRQGRRHFSADSAGHGLRNPDHPARARQEPASERGGGRGDRAHARAAPGPGRSNEARQVRRDLLRHGPLDDSRQAHELGGCAVAGGRAERIHEVRLHADARTWQRDRVGHGPALVDRLSVRRQPEQGLPAIQSRRVLDRGSDRSRGQRRRAHPGRRSGCDNAATRHRPSGAHPHDRAGSQGDAHEPPRARAHHDRSHGRERARDRLSHGRNPLAAAADSQRRPTPPTRKSSGVSGRRWRPNPPGLP